MEKISVIILSFCAFTLAAIPSAFAAEAGGDGGGLLGAIGIDPQTIILQVIGFLVVLFVLWKFVFGRIGGLLDDRQLEITSRMEKLEADQLELDRLNAETRQRLSEIESEGQAKIQAAIDEGNAERQRILDTARQDAGAELEKARAAIQREKEEAILELRGTVAEIAIDAAGKIIDQTLDAEKHRHIIDESIGRLPAQNTQ
ncbi:MAG: F0F1 ATP synthase subunit B [Candidatus Poribacteria bacterium]|nr:F0F1 ATP synthase subunit B [Candidatus Poribacteria bacterium]